MLAALYRDPRFTDLVREVWVPPNMAIVHTMNQFWGRAQECNRQVFGNIFDRK